MSFWLLRVDRLLEVVSRHQVLKTLPHTPMMAPLSRFTLVFGIFATTLIYSSKKYGIENKNEGVNRSLSWDWNAGPLAKATSCWHPSFTSIHLLVEVTSPWGPFRSMMVASDGDRYPWNLWVGEIDEMEWILMRLCNPKLGQEMSNRCVLFRCKILSYKLLRY